ncbi:MAG: FAD-dependent oxidoreductase, partial [Hungatella sp.]
ALLQYRQLIQSQSIFCHYEELPSFLYSTSVSEPLKQEEEAARKLGVSADFLTQTELPFSLSGALCFPNQAQFHPLEFLQALSQELTIYETTTALSVKGNRIVTNHGAVTAEHIVFACHYPFINFPGFYFSKMYQQRSYSLALSKAQPLHGMYLSIDPNGLSFRQSGDLLLFGGGGHRCGKIPTVNPYQALQSTARLFWPECKVAAHWSAQDAMTLDGLPYIGQFSSVRPNWYVATGFNKWGMSASMVAAMLLSDRICGKSNPYAAIFSPRRFSLKASFSDGTAHLAESAKGLLLGASGSPARCSHMGCKLSWNPAESTWECPCHGSRFDHSGHLLNGPAQMDLRF